MQVARDSRNLDFLRAIAVLFVLFDHTMQFFGHPALGRMKMSWLGGLGVSFFFVHTCLVLMASLERQRRKLSGLPLLWSFYLRRVFRIYPLCFFAVLAVALFDIPSRSISPGVVNHVPPSLGEVAANMLLVQNLTFHHDVIGVLWSLPLEMQMYLFLPFLFLFSDRFGWKRVLALWILCVPLALLQPVAPFPGAARLNIFQYFPRFVPGVLAYALTLRVAPRLPGWCWPVFLAGLTGASVLLPPRNESTWPICLALGAAIPFFREMPGGATARVSSLLARYSYGLYLTHVFCIWTAFVALDRLPFAARVAVFAVMVPGLPAILFHALESPFTKAGIALSARWTGRRRVLAAEATS
jgi:peptidoglycan/LPS O-acetylase OafA/YrhL